MIPFIGSSALVVAEVPFESITFQNITNSWDEIFQPFKGKLTDSTLLLLSDQNKDVLSAISDVNSNVVSTQASVQDVKSAVATGNQGIEEHLTRQDKTLNDISTYVKKAATYAANAWYYAREVYRLLTGKPY